MIKCLIADDEFPQRQLIAAYLSRFPNIELVATCKNGNEVLQALNSVTPDVLFLDIEMPELNGVELARQIKSRSLKIIFISAYSRYAINGYEVNAIDYLLKPVSLDRFTSCMNKILEQLPNTPTGTARPSNEFILLKADQRLTKVFVNDIVFIEGLKEYVRYHLIDGRKIITLDSLKNICEELESKGFTRAHKSYIVNLNHIRSIGPASLDIKGTEIPVGALYKDSLVTNYKRKNG